MIPFIKTDLHLGAILLWQLKKKKMEIQKGLNVMMMMIA